MLPWVLPAPPAAAVTAILWQWSAGIAHNDVHADKCRSHCLSLLLSYYSMDVKKLIHTVHAHRGHALCW
jgi:hypothetical protein